MLSRARVYVLRALTFDDIVAVLQRALEREFSGQDPVTTEPDALATIARAADGDARRALNLLEVAADLPVSVVARPRSSSPAEGSAARHAQNQERLIAQTWASASPQKGSKR